jgi:hypothetical protein
MKVAIYTRESGTRQYKPASPRALYAPNTGFCLRYTEQGKRKWQQLNVSMQLQQNFNLPAPHPLPACNVAPQFKPQSPPNELTLIGPSIDT